MNKRELYDAAREYEHHADIAATMKLIRDESATLMSDLANIVDGWSDVMTEAQRSGGLVFGFPVNPDGQMHARYHRSCNMLNHLFNALFVKCKQHGLEGEFSIPFIA